MKILVTGHDGFVGQHLVERIKFGNCLYFLRNDLRNYDAVRHEVLTVNPDIILHLAARSEVEKSFYEQIEFSEVNYVGTVNLIEAAKELTNLKNFIFPSTMEVYGWQPISDLVKEGKEVNIEVFDETTIPNPNAPYAVAKYACEKYLEYAYRCYGLPYTIVRQTNTYGRKDNDFFITEHVTTQMIKDPSNINLGCGLPYRNFLYIDDLIDAWEVIINNPELCTGHVFCLGPNNAIRIFDYVDLIAKKMNWSGKVNWNSKPSRPGEIYMLNSSSDKLTRLTSWYPKIDLSEGLDKTIRYWKEKMT